MDRLRSFRFNPTIDTSIYAAGDQLGPKTTQIVGVAGVGLEGPKNVRLQSLILSDASKQKPQVDIVFWNSLPTIASVDNAAFDLTDAQAAAKFAGKISIVTADYLDSTSNSLGIKNFLNTLMKTAKNTDNPLGQDMWFTMVVTTGTPTFAALALQLELQFEVF